MSAQIAIVCDHCGDIGPIGPTPQEARAELRGWVRKHGLDMCPLCHFILDSRVRSNARVRVTTGGGFA